MFIFIHQVIAQARFFKQEQPGSKICDFYPIIYGLSSNPHKTSPLGGLILTKCYIQRNMHPTLKHDFFKD